MKLKSILNKNDIKQISGGECGCYCKDNSYCSETYCSENYCGFDCGFDWGYLYSGRKLAQWCTKSLPFMQPGATIGKCINDCTAMVIKINKIENETMVLGRLI